MANLSRTEKYKDLRDSLQNDSGQTDLRSRELSAFESRLNKIDSNNFAAPRSYSSDDHGAVHARVTAMPEVEETADDPAFDTSSFTRNENYTPAFDNDYLDQYIREVKQYNIDQGNAVSENTQVNVLRSLDTSKVHSQSSAPLRPYPAVNSSRQEEPAEPAKAAASSYDKNTSDIPFANGKKYEDSRKPAYTAEPEFEEEPSSSTESMSKEDIMAEVQSMVNGTRKPGKPSQALADTSASLYETGESQRMSTDTYNRHVEADRAVQRQLLNETTQMRAQLDDYEDNLSEVSDKMRHTNNILNIVLIILILALVVILGIVVYIIWIAR